MGMEPTKPSSWAKKLAERAKKDSPSHHYDQVEKARWALEKDDESPSPHRPDRSDRLR